MRNSILQQLSMTFLKNSNTPTKAVCSKHAVFNEPDDWNRKVLVDLLNDVINIYKNENNLPVVKNLKSNNDTEITLENMNAAVKSLTPGQVQKMKELEENKKKLNGQADSYIGFDYLNAGKYAAALQSFNDAIQKWPDNAENYYGRALYYAMQKKEIDAIKDVDKAIALVPNKFAEYYELRGKIRTTNKDFVAAIADFDEAIKLEPNYPEYYERRGRLKMKVKDDAGAVSDFNSCISKGEKTYKVYLSRGAAKYNLGNGVDACLDLKKALDNKVEGAEDALKNCGCK